jgi:hypothetical protein
VKRAVSFTAGFAAGWIARSTVDSSREAVVKLVSLGYEAAARVRRIFALERERLDDLAAEARMRATGVAEQPPTSRPRPKEEHRGTEQYEQRA